MASLKGGRVVFDAVAVVMRTLIRGIDAVLRRKQGIFEYNTDSGCIFRASVRRLAEPFWVPEDLASRGGKMLEIHFRNECVPQIPAGGVNLAYAKKLTRMAASSFRMLADYLLQDPQMADVVIIGGTAHFLFSGNIQAGKQIFSRLGLGIAAHWSSRGVISQFFTKLYAWMLMWTYSPQTLRARKMLEVELHVFWISRDDLVARYATTNSPFKSQIAENQGFKSRAE